MLVSEKGRASTTIENATIISVFTWQFGRIPGGGGAVAGKNGFGAAVGWVAGLVVFGGAAFSAPKEFPFEKKS